MFYWGAAVVLVVSFVLLGVLWRTPLLAARELGRALAASFSRIVLGPLRIVNFFALLVLVIRYGPYLLRFRFPVLETLGRASLPVFCAHVVIVLVVLAMIGDRVGRTPLWAESALLVATLVALYAVAVFSNRLAREPRERARPSISARKAE